MANQTEHDPFSVDDADPFAGGTNNEPDPFANEAPEAPAEEPPAPEAPAEDPAPEPPAEAPPAPEPPSEPEPTPDPPAEAPPAAAGAPQEGDQGAEVSEDGDGTEDAQEGTQRGPRGGTSAMRDYKILYRTGELSWDEIKLDKANAPDGVNIVVKDDQSWVEARNNEHALRLGFVLLGRPDEGAEILPVPRGGWKAKRIRKAPPRPERERLEIS